MAKSSHNKQHVPEKTDTPIDEALSAESSNDDALAQSEGSSEAEIAQTPPNRLQRIWAGYWSRKKLTVPLTVVAVFGLLAGVPVTRYAVAGLFVSRDVEFVVLDSLTSKPVSEVEVILGSQSGRTNAEGKVQFTSKVGNQDVTIFKKYYQSTPVESVLVPLGGDRITYSRKIVATGRQISVKVSNTITGQAVKGAVIKVADSDAKTDNKGTAVVVVPASGGPFDATVTLAGFNDQKTKLTAKNDSIAEVELKLTPVGKLYFLSKLSGKIDVVKTNLDGTDRQTVVAGTGREEESGTSLLASRDWKYLALQARREGDKPKLYLIETATDKMTVMDEGKASFEAIGWSGHLFAYRVDRDVANYYDDKRLALKSFNADTNQINLITESQGGGSTYDNKYQYLTSTYLFEDEIVWERGWAAYSYSGDVSGLKKEIVRADVDGKNSRVLKSFDYSSSIEAKLYEPKEIVYRTFQLSPKPIFLEYENGTLKETKEIDNATFDRAYPTYLLSPDGKRTFWSEARDGKNLLFVGDDHAENSKTVATLPEFTVYGWYTDDYVLVSKKGSELYVMPASGVSDEKGLVKVSDYHKPSFDYRGYGGGYGGL